VTAAKSTLEAAQEARKGARRGKLKAQLEDLMKPPLTPEDDLTKSKPDELDLKALQAKLDEAKGEEKVAQDTLDKAATLLADSHRTLSERVLLPLAPEDEELLNDPEVVADIDLIDPLAKAIAEAKKRDAQPAMVARAEEKHKFLEGVRARRKAAAKEIETSFKPHVSDLKKKDDMIKKGEPLLGSIKIDVPRCELALKECNLAAGQLELLETHTKMLDVIKHSQRLYACYNEVDVDKVNIPQLTFELKDAGTDDLTAEETKWMGYIKRVDQLRDQVANMEETIAAQAAQNEAFAESKKKDLKKKEHNEYKVDDTPEVWGRVTQIRRQETANEFKTLQNTQLEELKDQLAEAEADLEAENVNVEDIKLKVGVAQNIIDGAKAKLAQAESYVALVRVVKKPLRALSQDELQKAIERCTAAKVPDKYIILAHEKKKEVLAVQGKQRRVIESMKLKSEETPAPDPYEVGKLIQTLAKLIAEAEKVLVPDDEIAKTENRLVTLAIYGERLIEAEGGGDGDDVDDKGNCIIS